MASASSRLTNLDLLRLACALMVLAAHYGFRMNATGEGGPIAFPEIAPFALYCQPAIFLFFMISGYVVSMSASGRTGTYFFVTRAARIWPTFFACATITALVMAFWPVPGQPQPTVLQWLSHALIVSRLVGQPFLDGAYWTIVYELVFYIWVFVLLATKLFDKHWREVMLGWLVISLANEYVIGSGVIEKLFVTKYSGCFLFGWALYHFHQARARKPIGLLLATGLWAIMAPILQEPQMTLFYGVQRDWPVLALLGVLSALALVSATSLPSIPLDPRRLMMVTAMTYPVYLLHQNIGYAIFNRFGADLGRGASLALVLATIVGLSWFVAHYMEPFGRPRLQRLLQNWTAPKPRSATLKPA